MDGEDLGPGVSDKKSVVKDRASDKKLKLIICGLVVMAGFGVLGWFYYDLRQQNKEQSSLITKLRQQIVSLGIKPVDVTAKPDLKPKAASCMGGSTYAAKIGKFTITLSDPNVIVRSLDGDFEGGPITQLSIGRCLADKTNVVDQYPTYKVEILAHPTTNAAGLRASFESRWGSPLTAGPSVTIAGTTAQTYTSSGLFNTKLIYFDHGGVGYQIELTDSNSTSESILTDVTSDWVFTP